MKSYFLFATSAFLIWSCKNPSEETTTISNNLSVQTAMDVNAEEMLKNESIGSVSIAVLKDGEAYTAHYGELDPGKGNPPTDNTRYEIASVTKTFTGTLVAQAVLDKKISLEDDIRTYLDGDYPNLEFNGEPIRIKHLLTHTSRLPTHSKEIAKLLKNMNDSSAIKAAEIERNFSKARFFKQLHSVHLDTLPGIEYNYSNVGANLTGHILEQVYKKSYDDLLYEFISGPNNMEKTKIKLTTTEVKDLANGYNDKFMLMPSISASSNLWGADGCLTSTSRDLIQYMKFQMDKTNPVVAETHRELKSFGSESIGYFWPIDVIDDTVLAYEHHGGAFGMQNIFVVYPEYNLGISVITNSSSRITGTFLNEAIRGLTDDLKPRGRKSIARAIKAKCFQNIQLGIAQYRQLKKEQAEVYNFEDESELNGLGYRMMRNGQLNAAIQIFKLNVEMFPRAANPYDSLGESYFENKQYDLAIKNYQRSFELDPKNDNAKAMVATIKKLQPATTN